MIINRITMSLRLSANFMKMKRLPATTNGIPDERRRNLSEKQSVSYSNNSSDATQKMVDPKHVVSYEDMLKVIHQPDKVIIDVREPTEVNSTGKIPSSINIPLNSMHEVFTRMSEEDFKLRFNRKKPTSSDELIFYCRSGRRSQEALDKALKLGFTRSKTYVGSWNDWSSKNR